MDYEVYKKRVSELNKFMNDENNVIEEEKKEDVELKISDKLYDSRLIQLIYVTKNKNNEENEGEIEEIIEEVKGQM